LITATRGIFQILNSVVVIGNMLFKGMIEIHLRDDFYEYSLGDSQVVQIRSAKTALALYP